MDDVYRPRGWFGTVKFGLTNAFTEKPKVS